MAHIHSIFTATPETTVQPVGVQALEIADGWSAVSIVLPGSFTAALVFLDHVRAAADNLASAVELRRQTLERDVPGEAVVGWNGAGSDTPLGDMEANRG